MGLTNALLIAIQTGVLVFLFPLYLARHGGVGPEAVGVIVSLSVLGRLVALGYGGDVSDRWGRIQVLIPGPSPRKLPTARESAARRAIPRSESIPSK